MRGKNRERTRPYNMRLLKAGHWLTDVHVDGGTDGRTDVLIKKKIVEGISDGWTDWWTDGRMDIKQCYRDACRIFMRVEYWIDMDGRTDKRMGNHRSTWWTFMWTDGRIDCNRDAYPHQEKGEEAASGSVRANGACNVVELSRLQPHRFFKKKKKIKQSRCW